MPAFPNFTCSEGPDTSPNSGLVLLDATAGTKVASIQTTASLQGTEVIAPELVASVQGVPGKSNRADAGIPDPKYL
jgi:hypothetical protein